MPGSSDVYAMSKRVFLLCELRPREFVLGTNMQHVNEAGVGASLLPTGAYQAWSLCVRMKHALCSLHLVVKR